MTNPASVSSSVLDSFFSSPFTRKSNLESRNTPRRCFSSGSRMTSTGASTVLALLPLKSSVCNRFSLAIFLGTAVILPPRLRYLSSSSGVSHISWREHRQSPEATQQGAVSFGNVLATVVVERKPADVLVGARLLVTMQNPHEAFAHGLVRDVFQHHPSTATVMQLVEADIGVLISKIIQSAGTARQNKMKCRELAHRVLVIADLLPHLQDPEMMQRPEMQRPFDGLDDTLREAHELVMSCQERSAVYRLVMARRQAERFRDVLSRIDSYLLIFPFTSHIDITRRPDRSYSDTSVPSRPASAEYESQDAAKITWKEPHKVEEFIFEELVAATDNFIAGREIGRGGFGSVYMGILSNGRQVAIKRIPGSHHGMEEFRAQITILSTLHHNNIIPLVGYCKVEKEKGRLLFQRKNTVEEELLRRKNSVEEEYLLIFDYMKNGSLSDHLHGPSSLSSHYSPVAESWKMRIEILLGVSCAIDYLHSSAVQPVIHRDISTSNILLDSSWAPCLSGFGLAVSQNEGNLTCAGKVGYLDPEYILTATPMPTIDVYSFGVVMLEVLTGRKHFFQWEEEEEEEVKQVMFYRKGEYTSLVQFALPFIKTGALSKVLDKRLAATLTSRQLGAADLVASTAERCLEEKGEDRPAMSEVMANLKWALQLIHSDELID